MNRLAGLVLDLRAALTDADMLAPAEGFSVEGGFRPIACADSKMVAEGLADLVKGHGLGWSSLVDLFERIAAWAEKLGPYRVGATELAAGFWAHNARVEDAALASEQAPANTAHAAEVRPAPDFAWVVAANGVRYDFQTPRQREVIGALYKCWKEAGDGAGMTESALPVEIERPAVKVRPDKLFSGHPALGTILDRVAPGTWALFLLAPHDGPQKDH